VKDSYQIWTVVPVIGRLATTKMLRFINAKFADMHFKHAFCNRNSLTALGEHQHPYPHWRQPYRYVLETVHCNLRETGTHMLHTCVGCGRYKVWDEEDVMDIVYDNP
jgi:hypothetical protein